MSVVFKLKIQGLSLLASGGKSDIFTHPRMTRLTHAPGDVRDSEVCSLSFAQNEKLESYYKWKEP